MNALHRLVHGNALTAALLVVVIVGLFRPIERKVPLLVGTPLIISPRTQGFPSELKDDVLDRVIPELKFDEKTTLEDAIRTIAKTASCDISVNWRSLETAGIERSARLPASYGPLRNIRVSQALSHLWNGTVSIRTEVENDVIHIATPDALDMHTITLVYNVRDLVDAILASHTHPTYPEAADDLVQVIQQMVDPEVWRHNGGNIANVHEMMGLLLITQTPENHRRIAALLDMLRRRGAPGPILARSPAVVAAHLPSTQAAGAEVQSQETDATEVQVFDAADLIAALTGRVPASTQPSDLDQPPRDAAVHDLLMAIENTVDPDSWADHGGNVGLIHETMGLLIVRQTSRNASAVSQVLQRMSNAIQPAGQGQPH
jgi:hypothetical protein